MPPTQVSHHEAVMVSQLCFSCLNSPSTPRPYYKPLWARWRGSSVLRASSTLFSFPYLFSSRRCTRTHHGLICWGLGWMLWNKAQIYRQVSRLMPWASGAPALKAVSCLESRVNLLIQTIDTVGIPRKEGSGWTMWGQLHRTRRMEAGSDWRVACVAGTLSEGRARRTERNALGRARAGKKVGFLHWTMSSPWLPLPFQIRASWCHEAGSRMWVPALVSRELYVVFSMLPQTSPKGPPLATWRSGDIIPWLQPFHF